MDLLDILKISLHLSDLYGSQSEPCAETSRAVSSGLREDKAEGSPENKAGWQLDLLGLIFEALKEYTRKNPGSPMSVDLIFKRVKSDLSFKVNQNDIISILRTISRDIPLCSVMRHEIDHQTALVNYRHRTREAELTKLGRVLIELAESKSDWLSSDIDALKIEKAIKVKRFDNALNYCLMLESIIQEEMFRLQDIKEEPIFQERKKQLYEILDPYRKTISDIQATILKVQSVIDEESTQDSILAWVQAQSGERADIGIAIGNTLDRTIRAIEKLERLFLSIIGEVVRDKTDQIQDYPNYSKYLEHFILKNKPLSQIDELFLMNGFYNMSFSFGSPSDIVTPFPVPRKTERPEDFGVVEVPDDACIVKRVIDIYRENHREEFEEFVRDESPFRLSQIISEQDFGTSEVQNIFNFISTSLNISVIGIDDNVIKIALDESTREIEFGSEGKKLWISDLILIPQKKVKS